MKTVKQKLKNVKQYGKKKLYVSNGQSFKAGVHVKAVLRSLTAFLPISQSRFKRH